jgi:hypothetical protein
MRLIDAESLQLREFFGDVPEYAILSHTWDEGELSLQDWNHLDEAQKKAGYAKIKGSCHQALKDGLKYVWVDTNCIDKTSSSELSEAINSMYGWYRDSKVCYVYLSDVSVPENYDGGDCTSIPAIRDTIRRSRWFTRGWTLQELIAPTMLVFYSQEWRQLGTKKTERALISEITGIDSDYLRQPKKVQHASIARRMSWMAKRTTTRVEDIAYCMLGIFDINMALLYGEGNKAFLRLQEEIIKVSNDQTIFCWRAGPHNKGRVPDDWVSILAPHPAVFQDSAQFFPEPGTSASPIGPYAITNYGLSITVPLFYTATGVCAMLDVGIRTGRRDPLSRVMVRLQRVPGTTDGHYVRLLADLLVTAVPAKLSESRTQIFVDCRNARSRGMDGLVVTRISSPHVGLTSCDRRVLLLTFNTAVDVDMKPEAAVGVDFHCLESAVEVNHDMSTERGGILLRGRMGGSEDFLLFIGGMRDDRNEIKWHIEILAADFPDLSPWPFEGLGAFLNSLKKELFGTWCASWPLKSMASWSYSERGAIICFLELDKIEVVHSQIPSADGDRFQCLRRSNVSESPLRTFTSLSVNMEVKDAATY